MSKGQAGGETAEGQDGCAAPLLAGPALAHRFALGKVTLDVGVTGAYILTIEQVRPVRLKKLADSPAGEVRFVALRAEPDAGHTYDLDFGVDAVTIYCAGIVGGAVSVSAAAPASKAPAWSRYEDLIVGHHADGLRTWVFIKVESDSDWLSVALNADPDVPGTYNASLSMQVGPLAPVASQNGLLLAGFVGRPPGGNQVPVVIKYGMEGIEIPTEQNPDNFGPQLDFAAQVLLEA